MPAAKIDIYTAEKQATVAVCGEIDLSVRDELMTALAGAVARIHGGQVVVDLSQTSFMDATGIRALIGGMRAATDAGGEFWVTGACGIVACVLKTAGLLETLTRPGQR